MSVLKTIIESRIQYYIDTITLNEKLSLVDNPDKTREEKIKEIFNNIESLYKTKIAKFKANSITTTAASDIKTIKDLRAQRQRLIVNANQKGGDNKDKVEKLLSIKESKLKNIEQFRTFFNKENLESKSLNDIIGYQTLVSFDFTNLGIKNDKKICFFKSFFVLYDLLNEILNPNFSSLDFPNVISLNDIFKLNSNFGVYPYTDVLYSSQVINKKTKNEESIIQSILWPEYNIELYESYSPFDFKASIMNMFILLDLLDIDLIIVNDPVLVFKEAPSKQAYLLSDTEGIKDVDREKHSYYVSKNLFVDNTNHDYKISRDLFVYFLFKDISYSLNKLHNAITEESYRVAKNLLSNDNNIKNGNYLSNEIRRNITHEGFVNSEIQVNLSNTENLDDIKKSQFLDQAISEVIGDGGNKLPEIFKNNPDVIQNYLVNDFLQSITSEPVTSGEILKFLSDEETSKAFTGYDLKVLTTHTFDKAAVNNLKNNLLYIEKISEKDKYELINDPTERDNIEKGEDKKIYYNRYGIYNKIENLTSKERKFLFKTSKEIDDVKTVKTKDDTSSSAKTQEGSIEANKKQPDKKFSDLRQEEQDLYAKLSAKNSAYLAYKSIEEKKPPYFNVGHLLGKWQGEHNFSSNITFFMLNDPALRISSRNELELSAFLNTLSTIELSKLQPYLDVTLEIPDLISPGNKKSLITSSLTSYLFDNDSINNDYRGKTKTYDNLSLKGEVKRGSTSTLNNMSLFTVPQTLNNFNEKNIIREESELSRRGVQDITRPFMSINSFTIDVAPTQGLMSFKTGKLSLTLHDKSRIQEVSAFIKPDMFGVHGSEVKITYGWDGIDKEYDTNFLGAFLSSQKVTERYIITNSSFNITQNGEVKIDLSVAMRGPIDLKNTDVIKEGRTKIDFDAVKSYYNQLKNLENTAKIIQKDGSVFFDFKLDIVDKIYADASAIRDVKTYKSEKSKNIIDRISSVYKNSKASFANLKINKILILTRDEGSGTVSTNSSDFPDIQKIHEAINKKGKKTGHYSIFLNKDKNYNTSTTVSQFNNSYDALKLIYSDDGLLKTFIESVSSYISSIKRESEVAEDAVKFLFEGVNDVDPFYDRLLVQQILSINDNIKSPLKLKDLEGLNKTGNDKDSKSDFVSLGNIITGLISLNLKNTGNYDDIQIVSYCANKNAGLMSRKNLASLLIRKEDVGEKKGLRSFLFDLLSATSRSSLSLEGLLTQIIEKFINTNSNISYGLDSLFELENNVLVPVNKSVKKQKAAIDSRLKIIYDYIIYSQNKDSVNDAEYEFIPPKIRFSFDTRVSKENKTILRISIYDQNDNPFKAMSDIFIADNKNPLLRFSTMLGRTKAMGSKKEYIEKAEEVINKLIEENYISSYDETQGNTKVTRYFIPKKNFFPIKRDIKKKVPSLTYGTQNSAIIDASVTTVNEAKLNTVFMTRSGIKTNRESNILIDDLPLNVLPAQATATIYGCPFINFAQMLFLDFETNTTLDNIYAVTGIKHDISPGKFTTSLTLTYADVYGKYRASVDNINQALNSGAQIKSKSSIASKTINQSTAASKQIQISYADVTNLVVKNFNEEQINYIVNDTLEEPYMKNVINQNGFTIDYYVYITKDETEKLDIYSPNNKENYYIIVHKLKNSVSSSDITEKNKIDKNSFKIVVEGNEISLKMHDLDDNVTHKNYNIKTYEKCVKPAIDIENTKIKTKKEIKINFAILPNFNNRSTGFKNTLNVNIEETLHNKDEFIKIINKQIDKDEDFMSKINFPKITKGQVSFPKERGYYFSYSVGNKKLSIYTSKLKIAVAVFNETGIKEFIKKLIDNYCGIITG